MSPTPVIRLTIEKYSQRGEGVGFYQQKPVYVFGTIIGETVEVQIIDTKPTYQIGQLIRLIQRSPNRVEHGINNAQQIGGYELIHMNDAEQIHFKKTRLLNDFAQIAKVKLTEQEVDIFMGQKRTKYRNKIVVHDGHFYQKRSHQPVVITNYLLADIPYDPNLKGTITYRQLDSLIYGTKNDQSYTTDTMLGFQFRIGLHSFYQVNKEVAEVIYAEIAQHVLADGITVDLYSGIATIAIIVSARARWVYGVEINHHSYQDALFNIDHNRINNIEMVQVDAEQFLQGWNSNQPIDTLILDPARTGLTTITTKLILQLRPRRIIFLSCNPGNQAAALFHLKHAYHLKLVKLYDMFPQTYHIESLLVLDLLE